MDGSRAQCEDVKHRRCPPIGKTEARYVILFALLNANICRIDRGTPTIVNLLDLQTTLRESVRQTARDSFGVELEQIAAEVPPRTELGDLAFPIAFELAKRIKQTTGEKRAPRAIAEQLAAALEAIAGIARVGVAGAGYLNVFFDRANFLSGFSLGNRSQTEQPATMPD